jgi:hypothetical protein
MGIKYAVSAQVFEKHYRVKKDYVLMMFEQHGFMYGGLVPANTADEFTIEAVQAMITQLYSDLPWLPFVKGNDYSDLLTQLDQIVDRILTGTTDYFNWDNDVEEVAESFCTAYARNHRELSVHYEYMATQTESKPYFKEV